MDFVFVVLRLLYVGIFFAAVFISLKFQWGQEAKDERGKQIVNASYGVAFPLLPIGWLLIFLYDEFLDPIPYEAYKLAIWFLLTGIYIVHALVLIILKRKY